MLTWDLIVHIEIIAKYIWSSHIKHWMFQVRAGNQCGDNLWTFEQNAVHRLNVWATNDSLSVTTFRKIKCVQLSVINQSQNRLCYQQRRALISVSQVSVCCVVSPGMWRVFFLCRVMCGLDHGRWEGQLPLLPGHCHHMCPPHIDCTTPGAAAWCPVSGDGRGDPGKAQTLSYQNVSRKLAREVSLSKSM